MTIVMRLTKAMKSGSQGMRSFLAAGFARTATRRRVTAAAAVNRPNLKRVDQHVKPDISQGLQACLPNEGLRMQGMKP